MDGRKSYELKRLIGGFAKGYGPSTATKTNVHVTISSCLQAEGIGRAKICFLGAGFQFNLIRSLNLWNCGW
jgi:hypothetical protein